MDTEAFGVVFRVSNPRHRKFGRLSVFLIDFDEVATTKDRAVAQMIADSVKGFVVPARTAERMARRKLGRLTV